jgi:hypothetical protein
MEFQQVGRGRHTAGDRAAEEPCEHCARAGPLVRTEL